MPQRYGERQCGRTMCCLVGRGWLRSCEGPARWGARSLWLPSQQSPLGSWGGRCPLPWGFWPLLAPLVHAGERGASLEGTSPEDRDDNRLLTCCCDCCGRERSWGCRYSRAWFYYCLLSLVIGRKLFPFPWDVENCRIRSGSRNQHCLL